MYELNGKMYDMRVYYSNTGGMFSDDIYTYDFEIFYKERNDIDEIVEGLFTTECNNILKKINYLYILNHYNLYSKLDKIYKI